ncbi:YegP family protein [Tahibacter harae]|uniref:YegP family protein n=1 Tax=Tahibacter harae TaxID=2963937 RepID=A0ABT1QXM6_9GAMM|nr:YegP family protein [Tahibacter harae]MCQ4167006.1 YegP family protein [Tahibacter harae]
MAGKFTIFNGKSGKLYFNLKAGNGEIILASQGYVDKSGALNGVESVKTNAPNADRFEKKTAANGKFYFSLKAGNGQVIGNSEMYDSEKARDAGIASVSANAPGATLVEE